MILHIINTAPLESEVLHKCIHALGPNDHVLFIEDGVYHCLSDLSSLPAKQCHFLENDVIARGLSQHLTSNQTIDDNGFVELVVLCQSSTHWS